jgi:L-type amino acid transporter 9
MNYTIEETKNLSHTLPLSVMIGIPIVAVCYVLVNVSYFAILSYDEILKSEAVALVSDTGPGLYIRCKPT